MNLLGVQLITVPFACFMVYAGLIHYKKGHILKQSFIFWAILWSSFIVFSLFPQLLDPIAKKFHFVRTLDFIMVIAFIILTVMNYNNYISHLELKKEMEKLISKFTVISKGKKK